MRKQSLSRPRAFVAFLKKMNFNKFMHPRNIYRNKRNFALLGEEYPEFKQFLTFFDNGNATLDYKNPEALRCLTQTLLRKDFGLDIDLPLDRLIPAVPQRLNYVLWIEDLVAMFDLPKTVCGLDIGTGASCIFPLLCCQKNPSWKFVASELDSESHVFATNNVAKNDMSHKITVVKTSPCDSLMTPVDHVSDNITFTMCNPPFFNEHHRDVHNESSETDSPHHSGSRSPSASNTSQPFESSTEGGEVEFVKRLVIESAQVKDRVLIFTTMLGKKSSMKQLKKNILTYASDVKSTATTEFCQGKTLRWGLAWTFRDGVSLEKAPEVKHQSKTTKQLVYVLPFDMKFSAFSLTAITERLKALFVDELSIDNIDVLRESKRSVEILIKSQVNSWSNQRRKRREERRQMSTKPEEDSAERADQSLEETLDSSQAKRKRSVSDSEDGEDQVTTGETINLYDDILAKRSKNVVVARDVEMSEEKYLLSCSLVLKQKNKSILLKMETKDNSRDPETTHQLFQFLKNKCV